MKTEPDGQLEALVRDVVKRMVSPQAHPIIRERDERILRDFAADYRKLLLFKTCEDCAEAARSGVVHTDECPNPLCRGGRVSVVEAARREGAGMTDVEKFAATSETHAALLSAESRLLDTEDAAEEERRIAERALATARADTLRDVLAKICEIRGEFPDPVEGWVYLVEWLRTCGGGKS